MRKRITILGFFSEDNGLSAFFKENYYPLIKEGYEFNIINISNSRPMRSFHKFGNYYEVPLYFTELNNKKSLKKMYLFNKKIAKVYEECRSNSSIIHFYLKFIFNPFLVFCAHKMHFQRIIFEGCDNLTYNLNFLEKRLQKISNRYIKLYSTDYVAINQSAANFFYSYKVQKSSRFHIIPNGITTYKQHYHEEQNIYYRKRYKINSEDFVIGNIGRFLDCKNQLFLINSFSLFLKKYSNAKLVLIGDGPNLEKIRQYVYQLHIEDKVIFTGFLDNPAEVQNIFNIFAYPALSTGFSISLLRSIANGLISIVSDIQPLNIKKFSSVSSLSVRDPQDWANEFYRVSQLKYNRFIQSDLSIKELVDSGYGIYNSIKNLKNLYGILDIGDENY